MLILTYSLYLTREKTQKKYNLTAKVKYCIKLKLSQVRYDRFNSMSCLKCYSAWKWTRFLKIKKKKHQFKLKNHETLIITLSMLKKVVWFESNFRQIKLLGTCPMCIPNLASVIFIINNSSFFQPALIIKMTDFFLDPVCFTFQNLSIHSIIENILKYYRMKRCTCITELEGEHIKGIYILTYRIQIDNLMTKYKRQCPKQNI